LEARCREAAAQHTAEEMPLLGADWGPHLERAGFADVTRRRFDIDLTPPLPSATGRYARAYLERIRSGADDRLSPADRQALDALLAPDGPDSLLTRTDLVVRGTRTVWLGRRGHPSALPGRRLR
jgi:hypothetical protein